MDTSPKEIYELFTKMDKKSEMNPSEYAIALESEEMQLPMLDSI